MVVYLPFLGCRPDLGGGVPSRPLALRRTVFDRGSEALPPLLGCLAPPDENQSSLRRRPGPRRTPGGWLRGGVGPSGLSGGGRGGWPGVVSREDVAGRRGRGCGGAKLPLTLPPA